MHVIYIPGLGDSRVKGQQLAVNTWRRWGVQPQLFQMNWADKEPFEPKFQRLLKTIDDAAKSGPVGLVCASAGATAALNAFAARPQTVQGVVCIAGKIHNPHAISESYRRQNPAFVESAHRCEASIQSLSAEQLRRVRSIRGVVDPWVPARDSILPGAQNRLTWTSGHMITIAVQLIFGAPFYLRFLRRLKQLY